MHNKHFILLQAHSKDNVEIATDNVVDDFGNENSWWHVENVWDIETEKEEINNNLAELNNELSTGRVAEIKDQIKILQNQLSIDEEKYKFNYFSLSEYYKELHEIISTHKATTITADTLVDTGDFYGYEFDMFGFTNTVYDNEDEELKTYLVEIDVHS